MTDFVAKTTYEADQARKTAYPGDRILHKRPGGTYVEVIQEQLDPSLNRQQRRQDARERIKQVQAQSPVAAKIPRKQRRSIMQGTGTQENRVIQRVIRDRAAEIGEAQERKQALAHKQHEEQKQA